jgi:hypothetical protein
MADDTQKRKGPSDAQLDAAIEGARDMVEARRGALTTDQDPVEQVGGGGSMSGTGTSQGAGTSAAGPGQNPGSPAQETGGPRGAGTSISRTSGGRVPGHEDDPFGVAPDEFVKRETAVFEPGQLKKPSRDDDAGES